MSTYTEIVGGTQLTWSFRESLTIDNSAGSPTPRDVAITIPTDWDLFWTNVNQTDGRDIRVTGADGVTLVSFKLTGFAIVGRTLTINIDDGVNLSTAFPAAILWLYWGQTSATAPTYASFSPSSPYTAYALLSRQAPDAMLRWVREPVGSTKPSQRIQKTPSAQILVAIEYRSILATRLSPYGGDITDEEPATVTYEVYNSSAAAQSAMVDKTAIRIDEGRIYVLVKAGSDGSTYTLSVVLGTTSKSNPALARTLDLRAIVEVNDLIP